MPELPEVEVTRLGLAPLIHGKVYDVQVRNYSLRWPVNPNLKKILHSQELISLNRRGKYLLAGFSNGFLIMHLGMSGRISVVSEKKIPMKHDHIDICFNIGGTKKILRFNDTRRFGAMIWTDKNPLGHKLISALGPEPLSDEFNVNYLFEKVKRKKQPIKSTIMDSHIVVGVGNIYASESLFLAAIRPQRQSQKIKKKEIKVLVDSIKAVIQKAIERGGSTLNDFYSVNGQSGYFQNEHNVYARENECCVNCDEKIYLIKIGQRSSFYCKRCQV
ncbi:MAG: bifunctional DNA-formamidopyrimidine glycosylase/DNA-(apurinic or apyrimidinic site) lyase [Nitrosomonadales bacterium]|jgi:formamidopyrimidine-DNA glycosylase|nr:bifunctional DNA-formamidopyrimidine glycosylase/DNA-(apurinic or apyrimidinic site) lyase [Nitrosomonadales bacterium]MBT7689907.1 bifunctional DNA-formamidopyrimidine glycosylase/DNA-(apurinic or apyrimidinic site) lyase [Nitrosomonadales bacterium]